MKGVLLGLALTASLAVPASAEGYSSSGVSSLSAFGASGSGNLSSLSGRPALPQDGMNGRTGRPRFGFGFSGWAYYGDYDGNRSFDPDKWNDWWHDRPDRAYPAWMRRNQDCARLWYSGSELTC